MTLGRESIMKQVEIMKQVDSVYAVKNHVDPKAELDRLRAQVNVAPIELDILREIGLPERGTLVDIGCGPGYYAKHLLDHCPFLDIVGVDSDPMVVDEASKLINVVHADARELPFKDAMFDGGIARLAFKHMPEPYKAFSELIRIIKPGGIIIVIESDNALWRLNPNPPLFSKVFLAYQQKAQRCGADPFIGGKLYSAFIRHGLVDVRVRPQSITSADIGTKNFAKTILSSITTNCIDSDLISEQIVKNANKEIEEWSTNKESFGMLTAIIVSGRVPR